MCQRVAGGAAYPRMTNDRHRSVLHLGRKSRSEPNEFLSLARVTERHSKESRHLRGAFSQPAGIRRHAGLGMTS